MKSLSIFPDHISSEHSKYKISMKRKVLAGLFFLINYAVMAQSYYLSLYPEGIPRIDRCYEWLSALGE